MTVDTAVLAASVDPASLAEWSSRGAWKRVAHLEALNEKLGGKDMQVLDTLAAAQAEAGQFAQAAATAERAIALASKAGQKKLLEDFQARLQFYQAGRPYHETSPAPP